MDLVALESLVPEASAPGKLAATKATLALSRMPRSRARFTKVCPSNAAPHSSPGIKKRFGRCSKPLSVTPEPHHDHNQNRSLPMTEYYAAIDRDKNGPSDTQLGGKPYHHPGDRLPVKFVEKSITIEEPTPRFQDLSAVLLRVIDDGGLQVRAAERKAINAALAEDAKLLVAIAETGEDVIRKKRKEERTQAEEPLPAIEAVVEAARQHRRILKERRSALRLKLAPTIALMLERAIQSANVTIDLFEENERGRAEDIGVEFRKFNTLLACIAARRLHDEPAKMARNAPDLVDVTRVCRLLGITET